MLPGLLADVSLVVMWWFRTRSTAAAGAAYTCVRGYIKRADSDPTPASPGEDADGLGIAGRPRRMGLGEGLKLMFMLRLWASTIVRSPRAPSAYNKLPIYLYLYLHLHLL